MDKFLVKAEKEQTYDSHDSDYLMEYHLVNAEDRYDALEKVKEYYEVNLWFHWRFTIQEID